MDGTASPTAGRKRGRSRSGSGSASGAAIPETDAGSGPGGSSSSGSSPRINSSISSLRGGLLGLLFERRQRGCLPPEGKAALLSYAERRAVVGARSAYVSLPPSTKSTIALAVSSCGRFVASTHGDHTVKVTEFHTGRLLHTLVGHARTPWTVKFHPQDSTLLCSGCIGGEVRLWSLPTGRCLRAATLDMPVISLAFHPGTPAPDGGRHQQQHVLAIATFHSLYLWPYARLDQPYHEWQSARLLRCVLFPPGGASILLGLGNDSGPPRPPPQPQPGAASYQVPPPRQGPKAFHLFLWAFDADKALVSRAARPPPAPARPTGPYGRDRNPGPPAYASPLSRPRPVLERALLYNDGGVDVGAAADGGWFLVTCAELAPSDLPEGHEGSSGVHWPMRAYLVKVALPAVEEEGEETVGGRHNKAEGDGGEEEEEGDEDEAPAWATEDGEEEDAAATATANEGSHHQHQRQEARRLLPPVLAARALDGVPSGAVTSVKLSGSGRLVLLGYGVRDPAYASYGGGDAGPPHPVADVFDAGRALAPLATVRTREDEDVNIARFHPFSAQGFLYGSKQGRIRVFMPGGQRNRGAGLIDVNEVDEEHGDGGDG